VRPADGHDLQTVRSLTGDHPHIRHENVSTTVAFYAFATVDMMREAVNAATPAINPPAALRLTEDKLQALYSLR
jgi:glutathione synthase/RimK-type ligase-like ATP-grasp enzyme